MKVPDEYIEKLNKLLEKKEHCHGVELFYLYKDLYDIKYVFGIYRAGIDENFDRLIDALVKIEIEIAIMLCNYEESQKRKSYEGKS